MGDEIKYNAIAKKIMDANGISTNDLHAHALLELPSIQAKQGDVHFNKKGYRHLADKVARELSKALKIQDERTEDKQAAEASAIDDDK